MKETYLRIAANLVFVALFAVLCRYTLDDVPRLQRFGLWGCALFAACWLVLALLSVVVDGLIWWRRRRR